MSRPTFDNLPAGTRLGVRRVVKYTCRFSIPCCAQVAAGMSCLDTDLGVERTKGSVKLRGPKPSWSAAT